MKTILDLMKCGCTIELPSGYQITGDPSSGYIELKINQEGNILNEGLVLLNAEGLKQAFEYADKYEFDKVPEN